MNDFLNTIKGVNQMDEAHVHTRSRPKTAISPIYGTSKYVETTDTRILKMLPVPREDEKEKKKDVEEVQVDYDENKSKLYRLVEKKNWDRVVLRLAKHPEEASTWVSRTDPDTKKLAWRLLPIHAALYPVHTHSAEGKSIRCGIRAKIFVIEALLKAYPESVLSRDDQGMTPLHLASRNGAPMSVITKLLQMYPKGLEVQDNKNRTPAQLLRDSNTLGKERILSLLNEYSYDKRMKHEVRDDFESEQSVRGQVAKRDGRE